MDAQGGGVKERKEEALPTQAISLVAVLNEAGEILLLKRPEEVHCGGLWSLPGGKAGVDEEPLAAARRELFEETGLHGKEWRLLGEREYTYADRHLRFTLFVCRADGNAGPPEDTCAWVPYHALDQYPMPRANSGFTDLMAQAAGG